MHILFKRKVFCRSQRHTRCGNTLNCRVICQIDKQNGSVDGSCLLEGFYEEVRLLKCNTHSSEYNGEILVCSPHLCLSRDLGRPEQEKIGSFCPRTRVFSPSMADTPVWINSSGYTRAAGFIGRPLISLLSSGRISGPSSIGRPRPSNTRPSISPDTPSSMLRPRNRTLLLLRLIPAAFS